MISLLLSLVVSQSPTCLTQYGQTECGYSCIAQYGQVRCAQTPEGVCAAQYGKVVCFDPPRRSRHHWRNRNTEPASCLAQYGEVVCGYGCVAQYGQVRCAPMPGGFCTAASGNVSCFQPRE